MIPSLTRPRCLRWALCVAACAACSGSAGETVLSDDDASVQRRDDPPPTGGDTAAVVIEPPVTPPTCAQGQYFVGRVLGQLVDFDGRPMRAGQVTVCGSTCVPGESGADGRFEVAINLCFGGTSEYAHGAAFSYVGLDRRPDVFFDFNLGDQSRLGTVRMTRPIYVGDFSAGGSVPAPHTSTAAARLVDGLGFSLRVVPSTIEFPITSSDEVVRAVRVPVGRLPAYGGLAPAVMYAISPSDAVLSAPAAVEFPNVSRLPPGATVDIVAVGNHASDGRPAVGVLDRVDTGRVSADGLRVVAATGLRFFGTVGYRTVNR